MHVSLVDEKSCAGLLFRAHCEAGIDSPRAVAHPMFKALKSLSKAGDNFGIRSYTLYC